jgi:transposase InsO family protein
MIKTKDEVFDRFQEYVTWASKQGVKVRTLQCDNAGEYSSDRMKAFCDSKGINLRHSAPYCHESNGVAERVWRTVCEQTQAMLIGFRLPLQFWGFAMMHAFYVKNRLPHSYLGDKSPYEIWHGKPPMLDKLRVFGCATWVHIPAEVRQKTDKLTPKAWRGIYVGNDDQNENE